MSDTDLESEIVQLKFLTKSCSVSPSGKLHCLLEVSLGDLWDWIIVIINIHSNTLKDDNMINDEAKEKMYQRYLSNMGKVLEDNV